MIFMNHLKSLVKDACACVLWEKLVINLDKSVIMCMHFSLLPAKTKQSYFSIPFLLVNHSKDLKG